MTHFHHPHRHFQHPFRESRFCFDVSMAPKGPEGWARDAGTWLRRFGIDAGNIGSEVLGQLRLAFGEELGADDIKNLHNTVDFLQRTAPPYLAVLLRQKIGSERMPRQKIIELTNHHAWMTAIGRVDFDAPAGAVNLPKAVPAVREADTFLWSLDPVSKRRVYREYAFSLIDRSVMDQNPDIFGDATNRDQKLIDNRADILKSMRMIVGLDAGDGAVAERIAKKSLNKRYFEVDPTTGEVADRTRRKVALEEDYFHALVSTNRMLTTVDQLRDAVPNGYFKGALRLGVVTDADLTAMRAPGGIIDRRFNEQAKTIAEQTQKLTKFRNVTTENAIARFHQMPLFAKILLLFGLYKGARAAPGPAMGIGAVLFGSYLFGGRDRPLDDAGRIAVSLFGVGMTPVRGLASALGIDGPAQNVGAAEINRRAEAISHFLSNRARVSLEAITPVGVLADLPLADIMRFYTPGENGGTFQFDSPQFRKIAREKLTAAGLNPSAINTIFDASTPEGQRNRREFQWAVAGICYVSAATVATNAPDVQRIERARLDQRTGNHTLADLPAEFTDPVTGERYNPRQLLQRMISEGYTRCSPMTQSMGDYIYSVMGVSTQQEFQVQEQAKKTAEQREKRMNEMKTQIEAYTGMAGAQFSATVDGGTSLTVRIHIPDRGTAGWRPYRFTPEAIDKYGNVELIVNAWREAILTEIRNEMQAGSMARYTTVYASGNVMYNRTHHPATGDEEVAPKGEEILPARSTFTDFVRFTGAQISKHYAAWRLQAYAARQAERNPLPAPPKAP